jgi:carbon-monoxide dehydrogenase large subunit
VKRREDRRLVRGAGKYADDIDFPGAAHLVIVRSPHAHARIARLVMSRARANPGVLGVWSGADIAANGIQPIPHATGSSTMGSDVPLKNRDGSERSVSPAPVLATDVARYVGEGVAMIVAETRDAAEEAAELVDVDYEILPSVTRSYDAIKFDAPNLWDHLSGNLVLDAEIGDKAATDAAMEKAAYRATIKTLIQRVTGVHLEPRSALATWDAATETFTIHAFAGTGISRLHDELAICLETPRDKIRVITPDDVGGSFGTRNATYPEFVLAAWAARELGRPVKYIASRTEGFISDCQARDLYVEAELGLDKDGNFLAMRSSNLSNLGASTASFVPLNKGVQLMTSVYKIPVAHVEARATVSNTPSTIPYRSAGRPEAMFVVERIIDVAAQRFGFDKVELRRRNLIASNELPYKTPAGITYDSGDYPGLMAQVLEMADWKSFPARREEARKRGKMRGIGLANYIESAGGQPRERTEVNVLPDGRVDTIIGTQPSGQGQETSFAQLVADWLGVPFESVTVRHGDTAFVKFGGGSHSGRSMRFGSIVIRNATNEIIDKGKAIAASVLEAGVGDIEFNGGVFRVVGTDRSMGIFQVAAAAANDPRVPEDLRGPLAATSDKVTAGLAFPFGSHVCEVEVDPDTGAVELMRYTAVDDVGKAVNPMIVDGQTQGGIVTGLGQALMEEAYYDRDSGQMLSATLMDYALPRAGDMVSFKTRISEIPATSHPLGIRPAGEGGTTPSLAVAINAIVDALSELGVEHIEMPATPLKVWRAIRDAKANKTKH